jgi:hypothetical protein
MLDLQMKQHMLIIDSIERANENSRSTQQLQAREQVLQKMQEQIKIRDNLLQLAGKQFDEHNVDIDLDDPKLVNIEEIVKINSSLPPIPSKYNNAYGVNQRGQAKNPNLGLLKSKYKNKVHTTKTSLPPMNRNNDSDSSNYLKKGKGRNHVMNPYDINSSRDRKRAISYQRGNRNSQNNANSIHSRMRKSKNTLSSPSINSKSRYGYKANTAMVRDSSANKITPFMMGKKGRMVPKTGQRNGVYIRPDHRVHKIAEESKSNRSLRSNSSIISTASSNSPDGKKMKVDPNGLNIIGQPLSKRKAGNRFNRSPFSRHPQNKLRNYKNANLSIEGRANNMDKKQVLANLNKQYRNKYL